MRLILSHDDRGFVAGRLVRRRRDLANDVRRRFVEDLLRGVEAKAVEVEFVDPVAGVGDEKLPNRSGSFSVEVQCVAPFGRLALR